MGDIKLNVGGGSCLSQSVRRQSFLVGPEATDPASLPMSKRSVLGALLPESLLFVLETHGAPAFAAAMAADSDSPELIWTHQMRTKVLISQVSCLCPSLVPLSCAPQLCRLALHLHCAPHLWP